MPAVQSDDLLLYPSAELTQQSEECREIHRWPLALSISRANTTVRRMQRNTQMRRPSNNCIRKFTGTHTPVGKPTMWKCPHWIKPCHPSALGVGIYEAATPDMLYIIYNKWWSGISQEDNTVNILTISYIVTCPCFFFKESRKLLNFRCWGKP
jgi:hypothetical protein